MISATSAIAEWRQAIYEALEASSHLTVQDLAQQLDSGTPATQAQVRDLLRSEPEVFWPEEERWDLSIFHAFEARTHLFRRQHEQVFDQDRFINAVLSEALRLKGTPIDLRTLAEKYLLKITRNARLRANEFPGGVGPILHCLQGFLETSARFHVLRDNGTRYVWTQETWPEFRPAIQPPAYQLLADFLDRAAAYLEARRDQPARLLDILKAVLDIDANHPDFPSAFALANRVLSADEATFVKVQDDAWLLAAYLPDYIEEIPARVAIPRWRNPQEEKLVNEAYELSEIELANLADFAGEDEAEAAPSQFDETFLGELRLILPYHWRQNGVLKVNARERRIFPATPARVHLTFMDQWGKPFPVWLNNVIGYLYGLQDWYAENLVPAGGVFYLERSGGSKYKFTIRIKESQAHTFDGKQFFCEVDQDTYIEEDRLRDLEALRAKVEAAQATIKDVMCVLFEDCPPDMALHYKQIWSQVHVIRPTTRRTVAAILSMFPCFFQTEPGSGRWLYVPSMRNAPPKRYARPPVVTRPAPARPRPAKPTEAPKPALRLQRYWLVPVHAVSWQAMARPATPGADVFLVPWSGRSRVVKGDQLAFYDTNGDRLLAAAETMRQPVRDAASGQREVAVRPLLPAFAPLPYADVAGALSVPRPDPDGFPVEITPDDMRSLLERLRPLVAPKPAEPTLEEMLRQATAKPEPAPPAPGEILPHTYGPNPTIAAFIARYGRPYDPNETYERTAFAQPVKAGKNTPTYNAHSYHTKVPPQGIEPYIEHYTNPGDIILDPFCGSGMTGVAALRLGRRVILNDLSPVATHIAYNYCTPVDVEALKREFERIKAAVKEEFDWLYGTICDHCGGQATIQYTIWSDVFKCSRCSGEIVLWGAAVDPQSGEVSKLFSCPHCLSIWRKIELKRLRSEPVVTVYECANCRPKRVERPVSDTEKALIAEIERKEIPYWYPTTRIDCDLDLWYERDYRKLGIYAVDHFYTKRNLGALARLWYEVNQMSDERIRRMLQFAFTGIANAMTKMYRYRSSRKGGITEGTLYVPSLFQEMNVREAFGDKVESFCSLFANQAVDHTTVVITTQSATDLHLIPEESIDYVFTDPPYGSNIIYSDLSLLWEAWLGQFTDTAQEAVVHRRKKDNPTTLETYTGLMGQSFAEMYRALKPGRWASVVFHNTDDRVWRAIQQAVLDVGFEMVNALAFDKEQASFKQITAEGAANFDIVLNLRKPVQGPASVATRPADDLEAFIFERVEHFLRSGPSPEYRTTQYLHSLLLRQFLNGNLVIQKITIPYLERLLPSRFRKINDRWYLQQEAIVSSGHGFLVQSETAAIAWLEHLLAANPQKSSDLRPQWQIATLGAGSRIKRTLEDLLQDNFWHDDATGLWCLPTAVQREIIKRRRAKPEQLRLDLGMELL
jgi:DNA modification methylase/DNA-directed RNA polymerase subunit RPC12/RpoP